MSRAAFVNVLSNPLRSVFGFRAPKAYADGKPAWNAAHGLVKEPSVAGAQASDEIVHPQLELLGIVERENGVAALASEVWPVSSVEFRIEVILRDLRDGFIENLSALVEVQFCWSRN